MDRVERIEGKIDRQVAGSVSINPKKGLIIESLSQAMEFAKMMAVSDKAVPLFLRGNAGACLAICVQGYEWGINPFALANKSYCVNDRLAYESALYHAVVQRRAPIKGRIKMEYSGKDGTRTCRVWAVLDDESEDIVEYTSPEKSRITPQNSPLWKSDPDQQLFYSAVRGFARRHFPDVMMGIYTVDELIDSSDAVPGVKVPEPVKGSAGLVAKITQRPISTEQTLADPETGEAPQEGEAVPAQEQQDQQEQADNSGSQEPGPTESEVSHADDQPPADAMPPQQVFLIQVEEVAQAAGIKWDSQVSNALKKWALGAGPKNAKGSATSVVGKEHEATAEAKQNLFDAIKERSGYFAYAQ